MFCLIVNFIYHLMNNVIKERTNTTDAAKEGTMTASEAHTVVPFVHHVLGRQGVYIPVPMTRVMLQYLRDEFIFVGHICYEENAPAAHIDVLRGLRSAEEIFGDRYPANFILHLALWWPHIVGFRCCDRPLRHRGPVEAATTGY